MRREKTYTVTRSKRGVFCRVHEVEEEPVNLTHIVHHSPTGFEFGYQGSGPADLALSILADHFGETANIGKDESGFADFSYQWHECPACNGDGCNKCGEAGGFIPDWKCWTFHQGFKRDFIATEDQDFSVTTKDINDWLTSVAVTGDL